MADIFGRSNSALERDGKKLVKQAKDLAKAKKEKSRSEIERIINHETNSGYIRKLDRKSVTLQVTIPIGPKRRKKMYGRHKFIWDDKEGRFVQKI